MEKTLFLTNFSGERYDILRLIRNALREFCEGPVIELPNPFQGNISVMQKLVRLVSV